MIGKNRKEKLEKDEQSQMECREKLEKEVEEAERDRRKALENIPVGLKLIGMQVQIEFQNFLLCLLY